jgi:recombination protein RecA
LAHSSGGLVKNHLAGHRTVTENVAVAALTPRAEIDGEMGDAHMGLQARLMSQALRKLTASISKARTSVIFINQIRMKIGVMFGNPETTTGGNALKFYSSVRLDIRRIGAIKNGDDVVGSRTVVKVVKNKVAAPFKKVEFDILYGEGISRSGDLLDAAAERGIVEKTGTWYTYKDERLGQGRDNSRDYLKAQPELQRKIEAELFTAAGLPVPEPVLARPTVESHETAEDKAKKGNGKGKK